MYKNTLINLGALQIPLGDLQLSLGNFQRAFFKIAKAIKKIPNELETQNRNASRNLAARQV